MDSLWNTLTTLGFRELLWAAGLFVVTFVVSLSVVGWLLAILPATYFLDRHERHYWIDQHPIIRWVGLVAKNLLGVCLVTIGLALSIPGVPGQGLITILIGVMLLDFPGKRTFERKIVGRPRILGLINGMRTRMGKPSLVLNESPKMDNERSSTVKITIERVRPV